MKKGHGRKFERNTHQAAVAPQRVGYYLDEFTFRFNIRRSKSRVFRRLMQQAACSSPKTYDALVGGSRSAKRSAQQVGVG